MELGLYPPKNAEHGEMMFKIAFEFTNIWNDRRFFPDESPISKTLFNQTCDLKNPNLWFLLMSSFWIPCSRLRYQKSTMTLISRNSMDSHMFFYVYWKLLPKDSLLFLTTDRASRNPEKPRNSPWVHDFKQQSGWIDQS
jgi:hypothetical protein